MPAVRPARVAASPGMIIGEVPNNREVDRFLRRTLLQLRWITLAILLLITAVRPTTTDGMMPTWALILAFAGYSLVGDLLSQIVPWLNPLPRRAILDTLVATVIYFLSLSGEVGGPTFVLFFLAVDGAAASLTLRGTLLYTGTVAAIVAVLELVHFIGAPGPADIQMMAARLVMLGLVGVGMAIVTRRLALEQRLAQQHRDEADRLAELDRVRSDFFSMISHELRTPLTATRASLGMVETSALDRLRQEEWELLENARRNTERLSILIDDLLARNQLEAGTVRLSLERLDLQSVVREAVAVMQPLLQEKNQQLQIALPAGLLVQGDSRRLHQVVVNVLSNAQRHTPAGTHIVISGRAAAGEAVLIISDDGPGIPAAELEAIFQRFYRLPTTPDGSGLGLAIAKAIVELHGGRMWATSGPRPGSSFYMALPLAASPGEAKA